MATSSRLSRSTLHLSSACAIVGAVALFVGSAILASGGGVARLRAASIGFTSPWPAIAIGAVCTLVAWWLSRFGPVATVSPVHPTSPAPPQRWRVGGTARAGFVVAAIGIAVGAGLVSWAYGTESAAGADASGYLNAARLFASGETSVVVPLAGEAPWPEALRTMAPLGFRPGVEAATIVPTYAPGFPTVLAAAMRLHPRAWPLVVPAFAALAVLVTFFVGARETSPRAALFAACGVASSPVFLFHAIQPMSDVPTTAWWMAALLCAMHRSTGWAVGSGLFASAAIATRPNLAPLALPVLAVLLVTSGRDLRRIAAFCVALIPGVALVAWLNDRLYGHPLESGYGSAGGLFSLSVVPTNISRYAGWLLDLHPVASVAVGIAVLFWLVRRQPDARPGVPGSPGARPLVAALAGFVVFNVGAYLVYAPFENWTYLRFLLPSFPLAAIAAASTLDRLMAPIPRIGAVVAVTAVVCGAIVGGGLRSSSARGVFERQAIDERHELMAAAYASRARETVFVTQQHGGAVRYHLGAPIVRWDLIEPSALDGALSWMDARGLTPVILLDADEEPVFRERYSGLSDWARLDWPPRVETGPPLRARAYELPDRDRYRAGESWSPDRPRPRH